MKILVVSATTFEIAPFIANNPTANLLITGVGAPACIYALTKALQHNKYDFVIQAGIAGTFNNIHQPGQTVLVQQDVFADIGIQEYGQFFTLIEKGFMDNNLLPYTNGWLLNETIHTINLPSVKGITINTITDNIQQTQVLTKKFNPDVETMEGAALHYVCIQENVPFLQVRSISNFVGERIKTNWKMKESIVGLNENLQSIVNALQIG